MAKPINEKKHAEVKRAWQLINTYENAAELKAVISSDVNASDKESLERCSQATNSAA